MGAVNNTTKPFEQWAAEKSTAAWKLAAAVIGKGWPIGREVSEADFLEAITDAESVESPGCYLARRVS